MESLMVTGQLVTDVLLWHEACDWTVSCESGCVASLCRLSTRENLWRSRFAHVSARGLPLGSLVLESLPSVRRAKQHCWGTDGKVLKAAFMETQAEMLRHRIWTREWSAKGEQLGLLRWKCLSQGCRASAIMR